MTTRRDREIAALTVEAADPGNTPTVRVAALLTIHQRDGIAGCLCGWGRIGQRHPLHLADVLNDAGLLITDPGGPS